MDILTFISNLITALAWPIAVVIIVLILKDPLVGLLRNIKRFKFKDAELDFKEAATELQQIDHANIKQITLDKNQLELAKLSPRGAILESWLELEDILSSTAGKQGIPSTRPGGLHGKQVPLDSLSFAQMLSASGKISASSYDLFQKLRQIRNKAVHVTDNVINQEDAETFIRLVTELKQELKGT